jgi:predicted PolB exonuclease-like 3'-5' exonuclease
MSNKQMTAVEQAIYLIKQDYEANGRLRLAFVLQTLNKAKEKEKQQVIHAYCKAKCDVGAEDEDTYWAEKYYTETYGGQDNEQ